MRKVLENRLKVYEVVLYAVIMHSFVTNLLFGILFTQVHLHDFICGVVVTEGICSVNNNDLKIQYSSFQLY